MFNCPLKNDLQVSFQFLIPIFKHDCKKKCKRISSTGSLISFQKGLFVFSEMMSIIMSRSGELVSALFPLIQHHGSSIETEPPGLRPSYYHLLPSRRGPSPIMPLPLPMLSPVVGESKSGTLGNGIPRCGTARSGETKCVV
ncbi:hypothetical protein SLEP1_g1993 [Rubroshorea leprosula]|uniref:Uncharacterized protein n=1 Tax=Rubroshorea leprosula TaxID=152421 RepID=A0AAV5HRI7_9ROSI|nr:hypothetical protein SLEP1_g1993 [Rubroshorea leprosula]